MSVRKRLEHLEKLTKEQSPKNIQEYVVQHISYPQEYYEFGGKRLTLEDYKRLISAQYEIQNKGVMFVVRRAAEIHPDNRKSDQV